MASLILVRNVVGELRPKRTLAASRGFLAAARLSCFLLWLSVGVPGCQTLQNDGLTRSDTGCFIAVPIWQQWVSKG